MKLLGHLGPLETVRFFYETRRNYYSARILPTFWGSPQSEKSSPFLWLLSHANFLRSRPIKRRLGGIISLFFKSLTHKLFSYITCTLNNNLQRFLCVSFIYTFLDILSTNQLFIEDTPNPLSITFRLFLILFRYTAEKLGSKNSDT